MPLLIALGLKPIVARASKDTPTKAEGMVGKLVTQAAFDNTRKFESERKRMKADLVDSTEAKKLTGDLSATMAAIPAAAAIPPAATAAQQKTDFDKARAEVHKLATDLNAHAHKAAAQGWITQATTKLTQSDTDAGKADYVKARASVEDARAICVAAKKLADDMTAFAKKQASVLAQVYTFDRLLDAATVTTITTAVKGAYGQAIGPPPNVALGTASLELIRADIAKSLKGFVDDAKARLAKVDAMGAGVATFAKAEIDPARKLVGEASAAHAAEEWARCLTAALAAIDLLGPTERQGDRRGKYDAQRKTTAADIAAVKALPALKAIGAELDLTLAQADALADHKVMQIEKGIDLLKAASLRCATWKPIAVTIDAYDKERPEADKELAALDKHAQAKRVDKQRESARKFLTDAAAAASLAPGGNDPGRGWGTALENVVRARSDLAQAKAVLDGLGAALGAEAAAAHPTDLVAMRAALKKLNEDADKAQKAPFSALADAEFKSVFDHAGKCAAGLDKKDGKAAADELGKAALSLTAAKAIQAQHAQFDIGIKALEARRVTIGTLASAAKIKAKIDAVDAAIADAHKHDKAHAGPDAMSALRRGEDAAAAAERADIDRRAFNDDVKKTAPLVAALTDAKSKTDLTKDIESATQQADNFRFPEAAQALKSIRVKAGTAQAKDLAAKNPPDAKAISDVAAAMTLDGGGKTVDDLLEKLPAGTDPAAAAALAKGRFNIDFTADAGAPKANELASVKAICKMLAKVPADAANNPSLKKLTHADLVGDAGGAYDNTSATISLNGRPGASNQEFGSKLKIKVKGVWVDQLPAVDAKFKPQNEDHVDILDWASLHEVGHGVDDASGFMVQQGEKPDHGGWRTYGSNLKPIADAVGPAFKFYKTPEQQKYVLDLLNSVPPVDPPVPADGEPWAQRKKDFDDWHAIATSENVYRRQADCVKLTIGDRIYHEAYPRVWVSYLAAARGQGLTGYQFRAPGEWFSELYAGYKSGKLGPGHPALEFLQKLSP